MIRQPISKPWSFSLAALAVIVLIAGYTYVSYRQHQVNPDDKTIPTWTQLRKGFAKIIEVNHRSGDRWLVADAKATISRLFLGLFFGILGSLALGVLMGCYTPVHAFFYPPLAVLAKIPAVAMLAVFFVLVGTGTNMYIAMIAFGVLPTLAQSVCLSVKAVPEELQYKAYTLGASHTEVIWNVIFRQVLPNLIDAVRLQIGPAMVFLIAAEMVVADIGFGYRIRLQFKLTNMDVVYPYIGILGVFGFTADFALTKLQQALCPWYVHEGK